MQDKQFTALANWRLDAISAYQETVLAEQNVCGKTVPQLNEATGRSPGPRVLVHAPPRFCIFLSGATKLKQTQYASPEPMVVSGTSLCVAVTKTSVLVGLYWFGFIGLPHAPPHQVAYKHSLTPWDRLHMFCVYRGEVEMKIDIFK